ncbi:MAG: type IV toxin-antitoxin system AbiEi family antitoxin domain-containing protein [Patescibacteria group bacterium]
MKYIQLINNSSSPIFTLQDLRRQGLKVYPYQLSRWVDQGYLSKLKNGIYLIDNKKEEVTKEHIAFKLYQPSYLSLEWALSEYGLIPEAVYQCVSVTAKPTREFSNDMGLFVYRHLKKELFFGYQKKEKNGLPYLIAEPEKALLDYIYLNSAKIKDEKDVGELRLNPDTLEELDRKKTEKYAGIAGRRTQDILNMIFS